MSSPITKINIESVTDDLADAILVTSRAMQTLNNGRLSERAVLLLIKDATGLNMTEVKNVVNKLARLREFYLK